MQPNQDNRSMPSGKSIALLAGYSEQWAFDEYVKAYEKSSPCPHDPPETEETLP